MHRDRPTVGQYATFDNAIVIGGDGTHERSFVDTFIQSNTGLELNDGRTLTLGTYAA